MQTHRYPRVHPFVLFVVASLAAPTIAMLPAAALEQRKSVTEAVVAPVPIRMETVDVVAKPKPTARRIAARPKPRAPKPKRPRSTPALRVGFRWPVSRAPITSPFGWRPFVVMPGQKGPHPAREFHHGMDIACSIGQPVRAAKWGRVILSGVNPDYGNVIVIEHPDGWSTLYGHLSKRLVNAGKFVSAGTRIGRCGQTGRANGPHLHFEVRRLGRFFNPIYFLP